LGSLQNWSPNDKAPPDAIPMTLKEVCEQPTSDIKKIHPRISCRGLLLASARGCNDPEKARTFLMQYPKGSSSDQFANVVVAPIKNKSIYQLKLSIVYNNPKDPSLATSAVRKDEVFYFTGFSKDRPCWKILHGNCREQDTAITIYLRRKLLSMSSQRSYRWRLRPQKIGLI
jgi:hypothetical protein